MGAVLLQLHLGVERRPNDAGLIQALGRNHGGTDMQLFGETVKALSAAAAEDEQIRIEQKLQSLQVAIEAPSPLVPAQLFPLPYRIGAVVFGDASLHLQMPQLGVGVQLAIDEDGAAQACAYGDHHDHTIAIASLTETHLGDAGGIGIVEYEAGTLGSLLKQLLHTGIDPTGIDIGGAEGDTVVDGRGETATDGALPVEVVDQLFERLGHRLGGGGLWGLNAVTFADQQTALCVDDGSLDARA